MVEMPTKVIAKLELHPLNANYAQALEDTFKDAKKLVKVCRRYFTGVLRARPGNNMELTVSDIKIIKSVAKTLGIILPSDTITGIIKCVYNNFNVSKITGTYPRKKLSPYIPIRVSKITEKGKKYIRNLTLEEVKSPEKTILAATLRLGNKSYKRKAVCYITSETEKEPFKTIISALRGENIFLGDPSILVKRAGRYFLHLSVTRTPKLNRSCRRILGVDLGISGPIAAMFAIEVKNFHKKKLEWGDYTLLKSKILSSDEFRKMWFELLHKRSKRASRVMKGRGRAVKGQQLSKRTKLNESLHAERSKQFVYYMVNQVLDIAEELNCGIVAFENLRSFNKLLRGKKKYKKSLGRRYNRYKRKKHAEAARLLQEIRKIRKQIKLLHALPWGRFARDVKAEAAWRGIIAYPVPARRTSRICPRCEHVLKKKQKGRGFRCANCGFTMQVDLLGALNIAIRAFERVNKLAKRTQRSKTIDAIPPSEASAGD